ncbi:MAG: hypothetical protein K2Y13_10900 [Burkholderiaceae bacterium]|uniref:Uncharacterized protein n=1 Tax=Herminiimonas contaminans TaxID=1111140 RepID=A0ABS0ER53_9BURK|nr:hypothetical protein [Herminiimonas contaminans]MBF8177330.1 hypothetical protein [Herminiimonas contaminans]MBX9799955.1 hypothetical protein [Burkholderiaceae bacterium]
MKNRLYQITVVAASTLALSAAMRNEALQDMIYDSALTGGAVWAGATVSLGNLGLSLPAQH